MSSVKNQVNSFNLEHIGWKYYNTIRKKAVEQEFSWSGLFISLSIAFFIIIISASALSFINHTVEAQRRRQEISNRKIYYLEKNVQINLSAEQNIKYIYINCS